METNTRAISKAIAAWRNFTTPNLLLRLVVQSSSDPPKFDFKIVPATFPVRIRQRWPVPIGGVMGQSRFIAVLLILVLWSLPSWSQGKMGSWSIGANIGITNADQDDMNTLISRANSRVGITTSQLGNAWEGNAFISYRLSGSSLALQFRPSFFYQVEEGKDGSASYDYSVTGFTAFPIFRFYMLEDKTMAFFSQVGIGIGFVKGEIKEGNASVKFSGNDLGYLAGLGAEFCFFGGNHCMTVEGNLRILNMERVIADSHSGTFDTSGGNPSLSQGEKNKEVELDGEDLAVSMSGIIGTIGYTFYF